MRHTSLAIYREIESNGLLSKMRFLVYECLFHHGPLTGAEVDERLRGTKGGRGHYHKRLPELVELGVAARAGERECTVTGHAATTWDVTDQLPRTPDKDKKRERLSRKSLDELRRLYKELQGRPEDQKAIQRVVALTREGL